MSDSVVNTFTPDNLIAGNFPAVTETRVELTASSGILARGTVMAYDTVTTLLVVYDSGGANGADAIYGILADKYEDKVADQSVVVYQTGQFAEDFLIFEAAGDADTIRADARLKGIHLTKTFNNTAVYP